MSRFISRLFALLIPLSLLAACARGGSTLSVTSVPTLGPAQSASVTQSSANSSGQIHLDLAASGNEARYRVREQLANLSFPSDAIGKTSAVSGSLVINSDGTLVSDQSKITVDLTGLTSDKGQRDRFVQRNILETSTFPTAEFIPTQISGLPSPWPTSGDLTFQLTGNLTVHGVTRTATWTVTAKAVDGKELTGTATTTFTFADFNITQPRVPVVLSIADNITLELDFHFVRPN
jgi:polyisoprenoid-binding protein YceI